MAEELSNLFAIGVHEHLAQLIEEFDHGEGFFGLEMSDDLVKTKGHMDLLFDLLFDQGVVAAPVRLDEHIVDVPGGDNTLLIPTGGDEAGVTEVAAEA